MACPSVLAMVPTRFSAVVEAIGIGFSSSEQANMVAEFIPHGCRTNRLHTKKFGTVRRTPLWRFCGSWHCDSLQFREKIKIRSLAKHNVFAVLLTSPQGESQRTENPYLSVKLHSAIKKPCFTRVFTFQPACVFRRCPQTVPIRCWRSSIPNSPNSRFYGAFVFRKAKGRPLIHIILCQHLHIFQKCRKID